MNERQQLVAQPQHRRVFDPFDRVLAAAGRAHQFKDRKLGMAKLFAARLHDQRGNDRQRQRYLDGEDRPAPATDFRSIVPPICSTLLRTTFSLTPRPETLVICAAVEKPGAKTQLQISASGLAASSASSGRPLSAALVLMRAKSSPRPSVRDFDDDAAALVHRRRAGRPRRGLPAAIRSAADLMPWSAQLRTMGERILDQFEHDLAIELVSAPAHFELMSLPMNFAVEVADDARQFLRRIADRLHARLHDAFRQLCGDVRQPLQRHLELASSWPRTISGSWLRVSTSSDTVVIK